MRRHWKIVALAALVCCLVPGAFAALSIGNIAISPSGALISGQTQVSSTFTINFPVSGGKTFDEQDMLQLSTQMDSPTWTYTIVLDGVDSPAKTEIGTNVNINGWILSYPSKREVSMKVTMTGTAPTVNGSEEKVVIAVRELDSRGNMITGTEVAKKMMVINPAQIQQSIASAQGSLATLRSEIDAVAVPGLDTGAVEQKYAQASSAIQNAQKTADYSKASGYLNDAKKAMSDAENLVKALNVQKVIDEANKPVDETDSIITYLKVNKSMASDNRLAPIMAERERAADLVVDARDLLSQGKYDDAITKANEAAAKGQEALAAATALKKDVDANPVFAVGGALAGLLAGGLLIIVAVVVIAVVAVLGFLFFKRRRRRMDELG
jgi:uncharacterized protein (UPF0332 family)